MYKPLRFISSNKRKIEEYGELLASVNFLPVNMKIKQFQGDDEEEIARSKVLVAYREKRAPLFVDHTGLSVVAWNDLPGSMSGLFWDNLGPEGFLDLLYCVVDRRAKAKTIISYCDGCRIYTFKGEITGTISTEPLGDTGTWDAIFIPDGHEKTLGQMDIQEKNKVSMRRDAANQLKDFLHQTGQV